MTTAGAVPGGRWTLLQPSVRTAVLVGFCLVSMTLSVTYAHGWNEGPLDIDNNTEWAVVWTVGALLSLSLIWRHRWPVAISLLISTVVLVHPLDAVLPAVGLYAVVAAAPGWRDWRAWLCGSLATLAIVLYFLRDGTDQHGLGSSAHSTVVPLTARGLGPGLGIAVFTVTLIGVVVCFAVLLRDRDKLRRHEIREQEIGEELTQLNSQVARQAERERIAREVHDALGHRLSLVSLHAGALEMASGGDRRIARSATLVRQAAQQSMDDLQALLEVLRQPDSADISSATPTLRDLPQLVDETLAAGSPVASTVYVDRIDEVPLPTSRSAFRITQELLTNARKHAPGEAVRLHVTGNPDDGLEISATNRLPEGAPEQISPGHGLTGVEERAQQCGGQMWAWVDDDAGFRVLVTLPWEWDPAANPVKTSHE